MSNFIKQKLHSVNKLDSLKVNDKFILHNEEIKIAKKSKNVYLIESLEQYIEVVNHYINNSKKFYFRGVNSELQCFSSLLRTKIKDENLLKKGTLFDSNGIPPLNRKSIVMMEKEEFEYIRKFEENACIEIGEFNNAIDLVAAAQHFGINTRFIDWSSSPLIATLFALFEEGKEVYYLLVKNKEQFIEIKTLPFTADTNSKLCVKYISMIEEYRKICLLRKEIWIDETKKEKNTKLIKEYFKKIFMLTNPNSYMAFSKESVKINGIIDSYTNYFVCGEKILLESNYSNERIINQRGFFEIEDYDLIFDDFSINLKSKYAKKYFDNCKFDVFMIKKETRDKIINYINKLGINYYSLMRDTSNLSNVVNKTIDNSIPYLSRTIWRK